MQDILIENAYYSTKGVVTMNETTTIREEITTDPLTLQPNKADTAIAFLGEWADYIVQFIEIVKNFFDKIKAAFETEE